VADEPFVEISLEGGGSVRVTDLAQVEGTVQRVTVRDADGIVRITAWSDPGKLQAAVQAKLARVLAPPPSESPPAGSDGKAVAAAVLEDFPSVPDPVFPTKGS
jgi:hypothetical protein